MLRKHEGIIIPEEDPFYNDKLHRKIIIENLTKLITGLHQPFVISINSPWGTGKTVFIKMWAQYLKNNNFATLYFNAWENDFSNEPLISLLSEIKDQLVKDRKNNGDLEKTANSLLKKGSKIIKQSLPVLSKMVIKAILKLDNIKELTDAIKLEDIDQDLADFASEKIEDKIEEDSSTRAIQKEFRELLTTFSNAVIEKEEKAGPIVFFVDELDRCRPDYSVKLLESIKHLFNIDNFVFVIALDRKQIGFSVQTLYGSGMDTEGYLKRFIDVNYNLPEPSRKDYAEFLFDVYLFPEFENHYRDNHKDFFLSFFTSIADLFGLSLRDIEHCFTYMTIVFRIVRIIDEETLYLIYFLMPLRIKEIELYNKYISGRIDGQQLIIAITKKFEKAEKFFQTIDRYDYAFYEFNYYMNKGIILEYFLETAQLSDYQLQEKYREKIPPETPGLEKFNEESDINKAKQIIKKKLLSIKSISRINSCFEVIKSTLDFAENFKEK